ncbi:MAG: VWA domain-containing protein, partial [Rikenellaceae bacterium]
MHFANPYLLWLLLVIVPIVAHYILRTMRGGATINISTVEGVRNAPRTFRYWFRHVPIIMRVGAVGALIIALARPQSIEESRTTSSEGIDIMMAIDVSGSMLARDFEPDRITAAKRVASSFVADRYGDRIGLAVFAGEAFTQSPLTTDQGTLQTLLGRIRSGLIEDGTAIGDGLATALNRLRESEAKSKIVILLTDGVSNRGSITPLTAAAIAKEMGVKVYTIGVGTEGTAPYPRVDAYGKIVDYVQAKVEIDEKVLRQIAKETGGEYFRATNNEALESIYKQINTLEKSKVEVTERTIYHEEYLMWALAAVVLLLLEFVVNMFILKSTL